MASRSSRPSPPAARSVSSASARASFRALALPAAAIFGVSFAVRLLHLWQMRATPYFSVLMGDARGYDQWAQRLAAGDWIGTDVLYQAPLYPYFLGVIYAVVGHDLMAVRLVQALLGSLSAVLVAYAGWRLFSPRVGVVAGLVVALYAPAVFFDGLIQKSVLDVLFVSGALAAVAHLIADVDGRRRAWFALGVATGCLSLTRENALALVAVLALWAWFGPVPGRLGRAVACGVFAAGVATVLLPVAIRNTAVGGGFHLTTSQFGPNFYIGNHQGADGTYAALKFGRGSPEFERVDATELAERAAGHRLTPGEVSRYWTERALAFITSQPGAWLSLLARKAALLVNAHEMLDTESQESYAEWSWPLAVLGPITHFGVLVPMAVFGIWVTWPQRRRLWVLYAMGLTFAATTIAFFVFARYRFPLVPLLVLFAAAGVAQARRAFETRLRPARTGAVAVVAIAVVVCHLPLVSADRSRAITETNLGTAMLEDGRLAEAAGRFRRALEIQADYVPAFNNLGVTLRAQGQVDEAILVYDAGLRLRDDYAELHFNLANALLQQNRADEAATHLRRASATAPDWAGVYNNLGTALAQKGQRDEAVAEFERALAFEPQSSRAHRNLGNVLASMGRAADALPHLQRAVELTPNDPEARYDLGAFLLEAGRLDDALEAFTAALAARPNYVEAINNLGITLGSQGHLDEAIARFEQALRLRPGFEDAARNLDTARRAKGTP